ncbi:MAG: hypothetical protein CVU88_03275 [Firmicutes bacterium HGW-Firmicutes-13]|nr:MAG: hypothetical protein CVU88_03275 [Firmicutes bacterium HGW-Firmicutes-13]
MEHHYPPSMDKVMKEVEFHLEKNKELAQTFEVYKAILSVHIKYLNKIRVSVGLSEEELKNYFRNARYLLSEQKLNIDAELFREILASVCSTIKEASPQAPDSLLKLSDAEEFKKENIDNFLEKITSFNKHELETFIAEKELDKRTELDSEIIAFVIFMSLTPFYSLYMKGVREKVDFTIWRHSYCPVCGQTATIAKHRDEDGARVLECWLCHAQWVYPRLECPYCDNKDQKKLRFFYVPGDKARQVHVCEECKSYLKTIDSKVMEKDALLDLEAIATAYLDILAEREGYKLPGRSIVLN